MKYYTLGINKKLIHYILICVFALTYFSCKVTKSDADKPNIVYIMTDDHAAHAIGAYNGRLASLNPTPNIDELANDGVLFENCFCTNSICSPSRATILTGQYSQTNGVLDLWDDLDTTKQYLPREMNRLGYETAIIGKWHLKNEPVEFDYYKVLPSQGKYFDPEFREKGKGQWPNNLVKFIGHSSDVITNQVIDWLTNRKEKKKPFFLMYHFKAPHDMFQYNPKYSNYLKDTFIPEPKSLYEQPKWGSEATRGKNDSLLHVIGSSISERHSNRNYVDILKIKDGKTAKESTSLAYQEYLKRYLRCVKGVDDNIGRFMTYLKDNELLENTIIIYSSDQGMMLGEHDFEDKRWMYEESLRMPLIIRRPHSVLAGHRSDMIVNNTDYAPSIIDFAGGVVPDYMQGKSLKEMTESKKPSTIRESTYYRYWMHMVHHDIPAHFGIRTKEYKLIFFYSRYHNLEKEGTLSMYWKTKEHSNKVLPTPTAWEFYDLKNDPQELVNEYNNPKFKDIIRNMKSDLHTQRNELNETDKKYPHLQSIIDMDWDK